MSLETQVQVDSSLSNNCDPPATKLMELYAIIIIYRILRDFYADDITDIASFTLFLFKNDKVRDEFKKKKFLFQRFHITCW